MNFFTGSFQGFADFLKKHFEGTPLSRCFLCFHSGVLIHNSKWKRYLTALLASIVYIHIQNTAKTGYYLNILNGTCLKKFQNRLCEIQWPNWTYVARWLSGRYHTSIKINLSNSVWSMVDELNEMDLGKLSKWDGLWYVNTTKIEWR